MNRILLASALVLGVSGAAMAQQAPYVIGDFSPAVERSLNPGAKAERNVSNVDTTTTASITTRQSDVSTNADQSTVNNVSIPLEYGGR
ncbi:hypothetical protein GTW25_09645 [Aliihoeflea aestuarii]|jgi:hypothetical protein|uniref:hypothetical protein n=1 Tax=Aliihoeflea aestuarii TaxID=453840 RepID=UPI0020921D7C|nr:hypothetical protein [Aliihoeflea aestuarii]MCO6391290.1 hypothetical protein [Aliihoeflea aestuarii]